jgi:hypothetical protein
MSVNLLILSDYSTIHMADYFFKFFRSIFVCDFFVINFVCICLLGFMPFLSSRAAVLNLLLDANIRIRHGSCMGCIVRVTSQAEVC